MFRRAFSVARRSASQMDISNPTIIRVNNRNYRCLHPTNFQQRSKPATPKRRIVVDEYDDEETYIEDFAVTEAANMDEKVAKIEEDRCSESEPDTQLNDEEIARLLKEVKLYRDDRNGVFECTVHVPHPWRGYVIGKNCSNIKEICTKTKAQIDFPEMNRRDDPFIISAPDEQAVLKAYLKINELLQVKRKSSSLTHFLAIKCYNEQIRASVEKFKEIVKQKHLPQGFPESVFLSPGKMHLTISILALLDNVERNKAVSFMNKNLRRVVKEVLKENEKSLKENGKKFEFAIRGVDYMNDDPTMVKILYGKVDDKTQLIQKLCDRINIAANQELGLTCEARPSVKLHMSLMNTRYVPDKQRQYKHFDATSILKEFKDFHFGTVQLSTIELLVSGTIDESTGGYKSTHRIDVFRD